jgi:hydrogenase maturation protease
MRARVIALGQAAAGDDGVALVILERLRERGVPESVELVHATDDLALVPLLEPPVPVVIVDAVLHSPYGQVLELTPQELAHHALRPISTHGVGVCQAIELARALAPERSLPRIRIVAVTISRPRHYAQRLSRAVAAAVPVAVERVLALIGD